MNKAFIFNIQNLLNYDLEIFDLSQDQIDLYNSRVSKNINYYHENGELKSIVTYRCRLRGVDTIEKKSKQKDMFIYREIISKLKKYDGYIMIKIHHIDKYNRLIVDMCDLDGNDISSILLFDKKHFKIFNNKNII